MDLLQLEEELDKLLHDFGYLVVDLQSTGQRGRTAYRLFIERVDGVPVTLADCGAVSKQVRLFLEARGLYSDQSHLEVSSGGLDRVLKRPRDFERYLGSVIAVTFTEASMGNRRTVTGELSSFNDDELVVTPAGQGSLAIPRARIEKSRLVPQVEF